MMAWTGVTQMAVVFVTVTEAVSGLVFDFGFGFVAAVVAVAVEFALTAY